MSKVPALPKDTKDAGLLRRYLLRQLRSAMQDIRTGERLIKQGRQTLIELARQIDV